MEVTVRVAGTGGVVAHHRGLDLLHRDLHLSPARADAGGRVLGEPADDLLGDTLLGGVVRRGNRSAFEHSVRRRDVSSRQPTALGQVVVVDAGPVRLDVTARDGRVAPVDPDATMHPGSPPIENHR
jgi:hypothetical protein